MREIKFRAWVTPTYRPDEPEMFIQGTPDLETITSFFFHLPRTEAEGTYTLMQFTGLLDKNGAEIWEGDIVKCESPTHNCRLEVRRGIKPGANGYSGFYLHLLQTDFDWHLITGDVEAGHYTVIGNIYETDKAEAA